MTVEHQVGRMHASRAVTNGHGQHGNSHTRAREGHAKEKSRRDTLPAGQPPRAEREALGRALRDRVPRSDHATFVPNSKRDPLALIDATNASRIPDLVPIRWGRMFDSPFPFYRGAPALMAFDLAKTPATGLHVQASGDAHLLNFGAFGTPERNHIVDLNDFDETYPAPWEWDVKRLAASIVIAAREVGGISSRAARDAAEAAAREYREHMLELAQSDPLSVYYERLDIDDVAPFLRRSRAESERERLRAVRKAAETVPKFTELVGSEMRIISRPPIIQPLAPQHDALARRVFVDYYRTLREDRRVLVERYRVVDIALKVVGVGSVGTHCFIALLEADGVPFFLQVKEALESVLAPYVRGPRYDNDGKRVVVGQRLMQAASDIFLGWATSGQRWFYMRQFRDMKMALNMANLDGPSLEGAGRLCGRILARAHARSGDPAAIGAYLGKSDAFDVAVRKFAVAYADQNEKDHAALQQAIRLGTIKAIVGA